MGFKDKLKVQRKKITVCSRKLTTDTQATIRDVNYIRVRDTSNLIRGKIIRSKSEKKIFEFESGKNYPNSSSIQMGFGGKTTTNPIFKSNLTILLDN